MNFGAQLNFINANESFSEAACARLAFVPHAPSGRRRSMCRMGQAASASRTRIPRNLRQRCLSAGSVRLRTLIT
jgi:hypothetical protein